MRKEVRLKNKLRLEKRRAKLAKEHARDVRRQQRTQEATA